MIVARALLAAVLVFAIVPHAEAQDRLHGRLDEPTYTVIHQLIDSARKVKLPVVSIEDRALEGASSGAADSTIIAGVRLYTAQLGVAYKTLGPDTKSGELRAAVSAIDAGISSRDLVRIRRAGAKGRSITTACTVLSDITGRGVPAATSTDLVVRLLDAHIKDDDLLSFSRWVKQDVEKGADPTTAAKARAQGLVTKAGRVTPGEESR